jgi:hypothetical protein
VICGCQAQKAVLEPPYVKAQQRPELGNDGELTVEGQAMIDADGWGGIGRNPPGGRAAAAAAAVQRGARL